MSMKYFLKSSIRLIANLVIKVAPVKIGGELKAHKIMHKLSAIKALNS
jgi:hypothetical protein